MTAARATMTAPDSSQIWVQIVWLMVLALPIASIAWTVTHEELFREPREYCISRSRSCRRVLERKFFYVFTCEYCFSHYVTAGVLALTGYHLLLDDWRGVVIAFFAVTAIVNVYLSLYGLLRVDIKAERVDIAAKESEIAERRDQLTSPGDEAASSSSRAS